MRILLRTVAMLLLGVILGACDSTTVATPAPTTITIAGSTAMRRPLQDLPAAFSRQHPGVLFVIRGGGSTIGEELALNGAVDLGASTLFVPEAATGTAEPAVAAAAAPADTLVRVPIGLDGLALIVHPSNNVTELSLVQVQAIFGGRVLNWLAVGGDAGEIELVSREDGSGARILFEQRVMGEEQVSLTAVVMPTSADVVEYVSRHPAAIGYVSRAEVAEWIPDTSAGAPPSAPPSVPGGTPVATEMPPAVKVLRLEGRLPQIESLRSQEYALIQPFYLLTNGPASGWVRQFIDFVLSPAGQTIVSHYSAPIR